jgi:hypothetical protein
VYIIGCNFAYAERSLSGSEERARTEDSMNGVSMIYIRKYELGWGEDRNNYITREFMSCIADRSG